MQLKRCIRLFRIVLTWFVINTVLGLIITLIVSLNSPASLLKTFIRSEVNSHVISSFSAAAGYIAGGKFRRMSFIPGVTVTILCVYPATLAGMALCMAFNYGLTGTGDTHIVKVLLLSLVLSGVITFIAFMTERLSEHKSELEIKLDRIREKSGEADKKSSGILSVKEKENYHTIKTASIIYLSAHGKKTVIHTDTGDYETPQLISELEGKLDSANFMRVHRKYIISLERITSLKSYSGGTYLVCMNDSDESAIPVGRTCIASLKQKLNV